MSTAVTGAAAPANPVDPAAADPAKAADPAAAPADPAKAADPAVADPAKPADPAAPEAYAFTMPDGMKLDDASSAAFTEVAKELKLPQVGAQKLIDLAAKHTQTVMAKQAEAWDKVRGDWRTEIKADKEFGGEKLGETLERAKRSLTKFGSPKMTEFLDSVGYGDNPELIRFLAKVDKATSEDEVIDGGPPRDDRSAADVIYGKK